MEGDAAHPRKNGELVFNEAWEGRIFGMAVAMSEGRQIDWEDFRQRLVSRDRRGGPQASESAYYERWLASFESLLDNRDLSRDRARLPHRRVCVRRARRRVLATHQSPSRDRERAVPFEIPQ